MSAQLVELRNGAVGGYGPQARRELKQLVFRQYLKRIALGLVRSVAPHRLPRFRTRRPWPLAVRRTRRTQARSPDRSTDDPDPAGLEPDIRRCPDGSEHVWENPRRWVANSGPLEGDWVTYQCGCGVGTLHSLTSPGSEYDAFVAGVEAAARRRGAS